MLDAGGYVIAGIDNDPGCRKTYIDNNVNEKLDGLAPQYLQYDMFRATNEYLGGQLHIISTQLDHLIDRYRNYVPEVPLLFSICAPCQSFTKFVQRRLTETRAEARQRDSRLLLQTVDLIDRFRPDLLMSENVPSINDEPYDHVWKRFQSSLKDLGYAVNCGTVCTSNFGIAQFRTRSILLANRRGFEPPPIPEADADAEFKTVESVIGCLPPLLPGECHQVVRNHRCSGLSETNRKRLRAVPAGGSNKEFPPELMLDCHRRLADKKSPGFGDVYTRMAPDNAAPTITTRFNSVSNGRFGHYDYHQARGISLREGAMLQSFLENYAFYGSSIASIARMIGNAVPPKLAKFMARLLYANWVENSRRTTKGRFPLFGGDCVSRRSSPFVCTEKSGIAFNPLCIPLPNDPISSC